VSSKLLGALAGLDKLGEEFKDIPAVASAVGVYTGKIAAALAAPKPVV
jgi:hypothetical protein